MTTIFPIVLSYQESTILQKPTTELIQLDAIVAKIHSFENLADGWHFGRGSKIAGAASVSAQRIAGAGIQNLYDVEIFPGSEDDILVALRRGEDYYEVIANSDGTITYFLENCGAVTLRRERRPLEEIEEKLNEDNAFKWFSIASSIQFIGTQKNSVSSVSPFGTPLAEESLSSSGTVVRVAA